VLLVIGSRLASTGIERLETAEEKNEGEWLQMFAVDITIMIKRHGDIESRRQLGIPMERVAKKGRTKGYSKECPECGSTGRLCFGMS